jgi:hypothetical protein
MRGRNAIGNISGLTGLLKVEYQKSFETAK